MEHTEQLKDSAEQTQHYEDIYELRLYVVGKSSKSLRAFDNLKNICCKYLGGRCHVEVIDLTKNPSLARENQIIAVPTLMRKNYPGRRIGDLSNTERVLEILGLRVSNLMNTVDDKSPAEMTSTEELKIHILKIGGQKRISSLK